MNNTQNANAAHVLAVYANNMTENVKSENHEAYAENRARYYAARNMLYTCTGLDAQTVSADDGNVTIRLTNSKTYSFTFES